MCFFLGPTSEKTPHLQVARVLAVQAHATIEVKRKEERWACAGELCDNLRISRALSELLECGCLGYQKFRQAPTWPHVEQVPSRHAKVIETISGRRFEVEGPGAVTLHAAYGSQT